jgi:hypothetical protein
MFSRDKNTQHVHFDAPPLSAMTLWAKTPTQILGLCTAAINFYIYQKEQVVSYWKHQDAVKQRSISKLDHGTQGKIAELKTEISRLHSAQSKYESQYATLKAAHQTLSEEHREKSRQVSLFV